MSLHYLLDGYNILKALPAFRDLPLEEGRNRFLKWIETARPQGSAHNAVTVVFDGQAEHYGNAFSGEIRVVFSQGGSADDEIKRIVEEDLDRKNCVVVSNDKDVYLYARQSGARIMKVEEFAGKTEIKKTPAGNDSKYISLTRQAEINKEFERRWLKDKK